MTACVLRLRFGRVETLAALAVAAVAAWLALAAVPARADFGIAGFEAAATNQDGTPDTQAGSHPYQFTTNIAFNTTVLNGGFFGNEIVPDGGNAKDVRVELPPGFVGDPNATPKCTVHELEVFTCPPESQIGVAHVRSDLISEIAVIPPVIPVYNLVAPRNLPAQFGFTFAEADVFIDSGVRTGGDYGLDSTISNISAMVPLDGSTVTLWGVPADSSHTSERRCAGNGASNAVVEFGCSSAAPPTPLLTMPTSCGAPFASTLSVDSWQDPGQFVSASSVGPAMSGCEKLSAAPSVTVRPESGVADSPSGLVVDLKVPQEGNTPEGLVTANPRDVTVALPAGVSVNPAAADGLQACSPAQIGMDNAEEPSCPDGSKVGAVEVDTPLLSVPLTGSVYVAQQGANPFGSLLAVYVVAQGPGTVIKLAGHVIADPVTGQLTAVFDDNPQLPFSELKLSFFGGPRAVLATPEACGTFTTSGDVMPWSAPFSGPDALLSDSFSIDSGCVGGFAPSFSGGTTSNQAGGFSPLSVTFSRSDQDQGLGGVTVKTPPGLLGLLKTVPLCGEPQASAGTCGQESLIGHTTVGAGAGPHPFYLGGQVFLTGPYKGAPFGLSIVVPAIAGPFNLGTVVVRAAINVDPHTAALTVTSDPLPSILQGIPLKLRTVNVTVDRSGFIFNPTDCEPLTLGATVTSTQGTQAQVSSRFQAASCAGLGFAPKLVASAPAATSRNGGAALDVKVAYPSGAQANIHSVKVTLPKQLPARLSTVQQACPAATFEANPASCGEGALIGTGTASTPIFAAPLTGPAYLVSHGGESFPDVVVVLQAQGVTVDLVGNVFIAKSGATSATFANVPDAPITAFELSLPEGPHSGLSAVGSLCAEPLTMPTTITGQNGAQLTQTTKISVSGCPKAKKKPKRHRKKKHKKAGKRGRQHG
jgi:hypothetical protein